MDLSWLQYLRDGIGLAGLCALLIVAIVLRPQVTRKAEAQVTRKAEAQVTLAAQEASATNGTNGKASKDYVDKRIYEHEVHCSRAEEILKRLDRIEAKIDRVMGDRQS